MDHPPRGGNIWVSLLGLLAMIKEPVIFLLYEQFFLIVLMASQGESSVEIGEFTSSGENDDSMKGATGTLAD